jgi:hypothetical protein
MKISRARRFVTGKMKNARAAVVPAARLDANHHARAERDCGVDLQGGRAVRGTKISGTF